MVYTVARRARVTAGKMGELNQRQQRRSGKGRGEDRQAANTVLEKDATLWSRTVEGGAVAQTKESETESDAVRHTYTTVFV